MNKELAFDYGVNYAKNGANEVNCNFRIFSKPEFTKAWETGRDSISKEFLFVWNQDANHATGDGGRK